MKFKLILLCLLFAWAIFFRLYRISANMMFLGDQGRDAIIVANIFKKLDPVFIGPVTSVGNMYLGPIYYYFMLPFLRLTYPSPVGPAYGVALLGIATVFLLYYWGQKMFGQKAALIATFFYALSYTTIFYSRFSWNPNPAPFVFLIMFFCTWQAYSGKLKYWLGVAITFSVLMQLHYVTILAAIGAGLLWFKQLIEFSQKKSWSKIRNLFLLSFLSLVIFISSLTPILLFDYKHGGLNTKAFTQMFTGESNFKQNEKVPLTNKISTVVKETHGRGMHILFEISIGKNRQLNSILLLVFTLTLLYLLSQKKNLPAQAGQYHKSYVVLASYFFTAVLGLAFYQHTVFDHYIAYLFPVTFFFFGIVLSFYFSKNLWGKIAVTLFTIYFLIWNLERYPFILKASSLNLDKIKRVSQAVASRVDPSKKYNLVLLSESHDLYAQSYRYYLETTAYPPVAVADYTQAEELFVINEIGEKDILQLPIYEIIVFPHKDIKAVYNVKDGPEINILGK